MDLESIYESVKLATTYGGIALGSCAAVYYGLAVANYAGREITSLTELEEVVQDESDKLGLKKIRCIELEGNRALAVPAQDCNNFRDTVYFGGIARKRNLVRHELFHIKWFDENPMLKELFTSGESISSSLKRGLQYLFVEEPLAMIYGVFGIKLGLKKELGSTK